jgi:O-antigen ligase
MAGALLVSVAGLFVSGTVDDIIENKFDGSDSSMGVRFDQIDVLVDAFAQSPVQTLLGHGIGARYPNGKQRDYSESQYIELQVLYVTYQLGLVGMALVFGAIAYVLQRRMTPAGQGIFWMYVISGITNPYILDTNQMVATMLLLSTHARARPGETR